MTHFSIQSIGQIFTYLKHHWSETIETVKEKCARDLEIASEEFKKNKAESKSEKN